MAKLSYNSIFTNVNKYDGSGTYTGIQIASKLNQKNGQDYPLIDAIDIDWDGAWLVRMNTYLNTSYDLINLIDKSIDIDNMNWINENLNIVLSDYVSYSYLSSNLEDYQQKLIPGDNISISQNNVVSAYGLLTQDFADNRYAYSYTFTSFRQYVLDRMFDYQQDERYDTLNKIYKYIISLERYEPINYEDIDLNSGKYYYIYNDEIEYYTRVSNEYILSNPDQEYYIVKEIVEDVSDILKRVKSIEDNIGYKIYDEENGTYSYTGIRLDLNNLYTNSRILSNSIGELYLRVDGAEAASANAVTRSNLAYNLAYSSVLLSEDTQVKVDEAIIRFSSAYDMAYYSAYSVGVPYYNSYFTTITEEDRERLLEDPDCITTYIYFEGDTNPTKVRFNENSTVQYYKYMPEQLATGMYKTIDDISYIATNSLFNLNVEGSGSDYVNISISPDQNDGTNKRTISLITTEAMIDIDTGLISQEGIVTTYSLKNTISYHSYIYDIPGQNDNVDGLIIGF